MKQYIYYHKVNLKIDDIKLYDDIAVVYAKNISQAISVLKTYYVDVLESSIKEVPLPNDDMKDTIVIISDY